MDAPVLTVTEAALAQFRAIRQSRELTDVALRLSVLEDGAAYRHHLQFVPESERTEADRLIELDGLDLYLDAESLERIQGATVDFVDDLSGSGFRIENPNTPALLENPIAARVQRLLEEQINPSIAAHGGHVTLVGLHEDKVYLRFGGGCQGCGMVDVTLKEGIVKLLQQEIPEITEVLDETDHEAGTNPYYRAGGA